MVFVAEVPWLMQPAALFAAIVDPPHLKAQKGTVASLKGNLALELMATSSMLVVLVVCVLKEYANLVIYQMEQLAIVVVTALVGPVGEVQLVIQQVAMFAV